MVKNWTPHLLKNFYIHSQVIGVLSTNIFIQLENLLIMNH